MTTNSSSSLVRRFRLRLLAVAAAGAFSAAVLPGCNDAQSSSLLGAGIGALAGQAIGRNTQATVIGTAVGAGAGYMIGNESDKQKSQRGYYGNYDY